MKIKWFILKESYRNNKKLKSGKVKTTDYCIVWTIDYSKGQTSLVIVKF